jgi:hypothetical protein
MYICVDKYNYLYYIIVVSKAVQTNDWKKQFCLGLELKQLYDILYYTVNVWQITWCDNKPSYNYPIMA